MGALEGCFFSMEKRKMVINANPMLIAAEANKLWAFIPAKKLKEDEGEEKEEADGERVREGVPPLVGTWHCCPCPA